eukprot:7440177-Pyramimonas_sp.AAC.1
MLAIAVAGHSSVIALTWMMLPPCLQNCVSQAVWVFPSTCLYLLALPPRCSTLLAVACPEHSCVDIYM